MTSKKNKTRKVDTLSVKPANLEAKDKYFNRFIIALLLIFGIYQSVLFFGHKLVPNSDFPAFTQTGRELLSFYLVLLTEIEQVRG